MSTSTIKNIFAREILDSRGTPTVEVEITLSSGAIGRAGVPSGASTGAHEALELRDKDPKRYLGKGVQKAVENVKKQIGPHIMNQKAESFESVKIIDKMMIDLDGTENKAKLGANAMLGVSLALSKAIAVDQKQHLFQFLSQSPKMRLPVPLMNVLNGGAHANNGVDVQEFMIVPKCGLFHESLRAGSEIFHTLKKILDEKGFSVAVGDEGGFAPKLKRNEDAMEFLMMAIEKAGYKAGGNVFLALDVAATELYKDGKYTWEGKTLSSQELAGIYEQWAKKYPLISVEDGLSEDDWSGWINMTAQLGSKMQLVGDDLFVTNPKRLERGIKEKAANALLVKVNQIGTLSETLEAVQLAQKNNYNTIMSHRSGETEDATIADLSVAFGSQQIKTGSLCRGERTAKYNQLLRIEERL